MKKFFSALLFLFLVCSIYSSEPTSNLGKNSVNKNGTPLLNHNVHTWEESNNSDTLVCKFCGEEWNLSTTDKIKRKIDWLEAVLNIRFEVVVPILICAIITLLIIIYVIKSNNESFAQFKKASEDLLIRIKHDSVLQSLHSEVSDYLTSKEIHNKDDYDEVVFIYNEGVLKTKEEVDEYKYLKNLSKFDNSRHIVNFCFFFFPFAIVFCLIFFGVKDFIDLWFLGIPLSLIPAGFISIITMIIGYNINISNAKYIYNLDDDEPSVQKEVMKKKMGILSAIVSGAVITHNTKKGLKEISDVDSWKEMK